MSAASVNKISSDEMQPGTYRIRWLILTLFAILSITYFPYLFGGKTFLPSDMFDTMMAPFNAEYGPPQAQNHFPFDGLAQTYPYKTQTKEALEKGKLAYWNPHILGGYPEYAESMANNFDIFNVLLLWLDPATVIHLETVLELLAAGIGMLLLLRFFGVSPLINLIFASGYMLNTLFIGNSMHRWIIASFCWVPFVILMLLRYFYYHRNENLLYASIFLAISFFGGHFQTNFFATFVVAIIVLFYPSKDKKKNVFGRFGVFTVVWGIAFALSAFMWLPTLELFFQTLFRGGSLNSSGVYAGYTIPQRLLSLPLLSNFLVPGVFGSPEIYNVKKFAGVDYNDFNGAIGFLPGLFAFWGCSSLWKRKNIRPFIILTILALLLPILTPLYSFLYHRFFIIASLCLCVIGSVSLQSFIKNENVRLSFAGLFKWTKIAFGVMVGALAGLWIYITINYQSLYSEFGKLLSSKVAQSNFGVGNESWMIGRVEKTLRYYSSFSYDLWLPIAAIGIVLVMLAYYLNGKLSEKNFLLVVFFTSVLQLFIYARSWYPSIDPAQFPIFPNNPISSYLQHDTSGARFIVWRDPSKDPYILTRNSSNVYKTFDIHGYESCTNRSMMVFYLQNIPGDSLDLRLLGLVNVKYIITGKKVLSSPDLRWLYSADSVTIYENLLCKPRAYIAYKKTIADNDAAVAKQLIRPDFDGAEALFTKEDAPGEVILLDRGKDSIHFDRTENEEVAITAETDSKGIFILTDTYYPGWKCYVNGKETPIHRANYCMRGIVIDAGRSNIIFKFEPDIFKAGVTISTIGLFLCLAGIPLLKRRRKSLNDKNTSA